jgi:hypothetical protein
LALQFIGLHDSAFLLIDEWDGDRWEVHINRKRREEQRSRKSREEEEERGEEEQNERVTSNQRVDPPGT